MTIFMCLLYILVNVLYIDNCPIKFYICLFYMGQMSFILTRCPIRSFLSHMICPTNLDFVRDRRSQRSQLFAALIYTPVWGVKSLDLNNSQQSRHISVTKQAIPLLCLDGFLPLDMRYYDITQNIVCNTGCNILHTSRLHTPQVIHNKCRDIFSCKHRQITISWDLLSSRRHNTGCSILHTSRWMAGAALGNF